MIPPGLIGAIIKRRIESGITRENCIFGEGFCEVMADSKEGDERHCPVCGCWFPRKGTVTIDVDETESPQQYEPLDEVEKEVFSDPEFIKRVNGVIETARTNSDN